MGFRHASLGRCGESDGWASQVLDEHSGAGRKAMLDELGRQSPPHATLVVFLHPRARNRESDPPRIRVPLFRTRRPCYVPGASQSVASGIRDRHTLLGRLRREPLGRPNRRDLREPKVALTGHGTARLSFADFDNNGALSGSFVRYAFAAAPAATPEPTTLVLFGTAVAGLVQRARRKRPRVTPSI
jgi:hypothetical protein